MADNKTILEWANSVCQTALTEARGGDTGLVNRIGANSAMQTFFNNVHGLKSVQDTSFPAYYPVQWKEITRLYEEYVRDEQVAESVSKIDALEAGFAELKAMVQQLVEAQTAAPKKGAKKLAEAEAETETTDEGDTPEAEA